MARVAFVGSRRRDDARTEALVAAYVARLTPGDVVVSGGAQGPDTFAALAATARGLAVVVFLPDYTGVTGRYDAISRPLARNQRIVDACDRVVAFVAADRRGGTEDTIRKAVRAGKAVEVVL